MSRAATAVDCGLKKAAHVRGRLELEAAVFFQAMKVTVADHDVIEQLDTDQVTAFGETAGELDILPAGRGIAGRMVMYEDDARGADGDRRLEDLTGVDN